MKIGNIELSGPLVLGPMAGVTDRPFRTLCREQGASLVCMEMVSANALKYHNRKTEEFIDIGPEEHPVSLQLFGPDPDTIAAAVGILSDYPYDILDLNMFSLSLTLDNTTQGDNFIVGFNGNTSALDIFIIHQRSFHFCCN